MAGVNGTEFRQDINGLRAVAVLAVMLFHFGVPGFTGGFVGVDVFFVISGFLMTRIILSSSPLDWRAVLRFYLARARRIFPALVALVAILLVYGWFKTSPIDYKLLAKHAAASLLFLSNQVYLKESGYFDADAHEKWLLHTWSLSVEWQFYLLYPVLILLILRLSGRHTILKYALWALFLSSLAYSSYLAFANPAKAFFMLPTRIWEMLAGGLIFVHQDSCNKLLAPGRRWQELIGLAAILAASMLFSADSAWPGLNALLPVAGAVLVIAHGGGQTRLLGGALTQGIGRWSYSVYLWHWPIVVWLYQYQPTRDMATLMAGIAMAVLLGWISFRLVEIPARRLISRWHLSPALAACLTLVLLPFSVSALLHFKSDQLTALRFKDNPRLADVKALAEFQARYFNELYKPLYREGTCFMTPEKSFDGFSPDCASQPVKIVLWGDSHAAHLWPGLKAATLPGSAAQWTASGCPPLIGENFAKRPHCRAINDWVLQKLRDIQPQVIVMAAAWVKHDEPTIRRGLAATLAQLRPIPGGWNPKIIVVGSVPAWRKPLPKLLASDFLAGDERVRSPNDLDPDMSRRDSLIRELTEGQAKFFSPVATACDNLGCIRYMVKNGVQIPFAFDYGHLVEESSTFLVHAMFEQLHLDNLQAPLQQVRPL